MTMNRILTGFVLASLASVCGLRSGRAQETVIITQESPAAIASGSACGSGCRQSPPWHGSMAAAQGRPACRYQPGTFHADPRGQLCVRRQLAESCATLPPCFPRLHACCSEGRIASPRPLTMPHCHRCGAPIEGGF